MSVAMFHSWWTVLLVVLFVGIVLWAFSSRRKQSFDRAARMPLEDGDPAPGKSSGERKHG